MKKVTLLSISLSVGPYNEFIEKIIADAAEKKSQYACVANVHMLIESHLHKDFADIVLAADLTTPDGKPLVWALRLLKGIRQDRVPGMELLPDLLRKASEKKMPVYFYGSTEAMLKKTVQFLCKHYPGLPVAGSYSPPFRQLSPEEDLIIIDQINSSGAALVFVVLGCPKQEKWMASMKGRIHAYMIGIGGALPVMIGIQARAPRWMQTAGLEWFYRLLQEPRRLFKRYLITNTIYIYLVLKELLIPRKRL